MRPPGKCAVVEGQLALAAKDRDRVCNMVERFIMRLNMLVELIARTFLFGDIKCHRADTA